jgi:predicted nucleic acid-binding protein
VIVVDASVLATAIGDDGDDGERARSRLLDERLFAPELLDLEVAAVWRRAVGAGRMTEHRARQALADLAVLPLARAPHASLMSRIWELRDNLTIYDAAYVALAEGLGAPLLTADRKLTRTSGMRCVFELVT